MYSSISCSPHEWAKRAALGLTLNTGQMCGPAEASSHLLFVGQGWVDKLAVENAGAFGVGRQEPDHKGDL